MTDYDLIVIGAGAVGENIADFAHRRGLSTAIVEAELVGGECSYWACMPSKALLRSGHALRAARRVGGAKEAITGSLDASAVLARRTSFTSGWNDAGQEQWVASAGIDLIRGHAQIIGPRTVEVNGTVYTAGSAVAVATGSLPAMPDIPGLAAATPWSTREATSVAHLPESVLVVGGGVAACELATAYASLGTTVTLAARSGLLGGQEPFAGELVGEGLRSLGVDVRTGVSPTSVNRDEHGLVHTTFDDDTRLVTTEIIVAAGRSPRTSDLGLESIGLTPGAWLDVDDTMLVQGTDWLYAVGDVNHRALLTHQGKYQARAAGDAIAARAHGAPVHSEPWGSHVATADHTAVPQVTFTDPEVASVGITERRAAELGVPFRAVEYALGNVAGAALQADGYEGMAKLVVDVERNVIVGATFVGQDVGEMLQSATIAIVGEVPIDRLWHAVPAYPTMSEIWLRLLETWGRPD